MLAPLADRLAAGTNSFGNGLVVQPVDAQQRNPCTLHEFSRQAVRPGKRLEFLTGVTSSGIDGRSRDMAPPSFKWIRDTIPCSRHYVRIVAGHNTGDSITNGVATLSTDSPNAAGCDPIQMIAIHRRNASVNPPSTVRTCPDVFESRSPTRRRMASAWSCGVMGCFRSVLFA